ncbi:PaaX family transcriptional regulator C-terminal domain-containing protein [Mycobacterium sp.]|uniref:PaaX family transcriptional regulator n=1 Tax=Mycobacterium sp. TaxID=1785 RepID=UPI002CFDE583|nr:PaaX family transcriptional regulator C-terminal domain-containing protein [Mycobacterium sp.]HKP41757.1 PaaX family transcriptional regulator C-terminal domain-containing protein [Mycobacterium sp.]
MIAPAEFLLTLCGVHRHHIGDAVWSGSMVRVLEDVGIPESACRVALSRLTARGVVTRENRGRLTFYRISERAAKAFDETDRRVLGFGLGIDPGHTVVWHTLPESNRGDRTRLSRRLRFIGFGALQDGTWIALQDRYSDAVGIVARLDLAEYCVVLSGSNADLSNPGLVGAAAWDLAGVKETYKAFLRMVDRKNVPRSNPKEIFLFRALMAHEYRTFPAIDPEREGIDAELDALRRKVVARFHELFYKLQPVSEQYANEIAIPTS